MPPEVTKRNEPDDWVTAHPVRERLLRQGADPATLRRIAWVFDDWAPPGESAPPVK